MADRSGRMEDRPKRIKAELLAYDAIEVEPLLDELVRHGHIIRYSDDEGRYIQIINFVRHQTPHHTEKPSVITEPTKRQREMALALLPEKRLKEGTPDGNPPRALQESSESGHALKAPPLPPDSLIHRFTDSTSPIGDVRGRGRARTTKPSDLSRLPYDTLPPEWAHWAQADMGWNAETTADVWACFRDYWRGKTGKSAKKSDWAATWRNWCRKETVRNSGGNYAKTSGYSHPNYRPNKSERARTAIIESALELGYGVDERQPGTEGT